MSLIHTGLLAQSKSAIPKPELKDLIFGLIDSHIRNFGIETEGINMISAAAACYKKDFRARIEEYWDKVLYGLEMVDQKPLFKATLTCVSDIARNHEQVIVEKVSRVFDRLVKIMNANIERDLKVDILKCFGDLALGLKRYTEQFLEIILKICESCFLAVLAYSEQEQEKAYAEELKEALVEMYHCLVFAVNDQNSCNLRMASHFPYMVTFVVKSNDVRFKPTVVPLSLPSNTSKTACT
jgi:hypothetical protein